MGSPEDLNFPPEPPKAARGLLFCSDSFEDAANARRVRGVNSAPRRMSGANAPSSCSAMPHVSRPGCEPPRCVHRAVVLVTVTGAVDTTRSATLCFMKLFRFDISRFFGVAQLGRAWRTLQLRRHVPLP